MDDAREPTMGDSAFLWSPGLWSPGTAPGWIAWLWTGALLVWSCWTLSAPGMEDSVLFLFLAWFVTGAVWSVRVLVALARFAYRRQMGAFPWRGFLVQPVIAAAVWALASSNAPLEARFALARGGLERDAKHLLAGAINPNSVHSSGGYALARVERDGGIVIFETQYGEGFAYAPRGVPKRLTGPYVGEFHSFHGPWYRWDNQAID